MPEQPSRPLVLLVEDNEDVREALEAFLASRNYRVNAHETLEEALASFREQRPDLVLTDIFLGPSSGLDLIAAIHDELAEPPPIIACSAMAEIERTAVARGADAFMLKPLIPDALERAMADLLGARAPSRSLLEESTRRSHEVRARNVEAARQARAELLPHHTTLERQAERDVRWLPAFLGTGQVLLATVQGDQLRVVASSDPRRWPKGFVIEEELPLCRDILETGSTCLVPDLAALAPRSNSGAAVPRFVAGFPFSYKDVPVGVLCLIGDRPGRLDPADFAFAGELTGVLSDWLSDDHRPDPRGAALMRRRALEAAIRTEFERAGRLDMAIHLLVFASLTPPSDIFADHTMIADLGEHRYGLLMTRPVNDQAPKDLVAAVRSFRDLPGFAGGDLLSVEARAAPRLGDGILRMLEQRFEDRAQTATPSIERIVVHREALDQAS